MSIQFDGIPTTQRVPFTYIEFDNTGATSGATTQLYKALIFGQKLSSGSATALTMIQVSSEAEAITKFGYGSMLHLMLKKYFKNNSYNIPYVIPAEDPSAGVAATGTLTVTAAPTAAGSYELYIAGQNVETAVTATMAISDVASAIVTAINKVSALPVTATAAAAVITLTAKNKGLLGNGIDIRANYYSTDVMPTGLATTIVAMAGGTGTPDMASFVSAMDSQQYNVIINPFTDSSSLATVKTEMNTRWGPLTQNDGVIVMGYNDTLANVETFGAGQNTQHFTVAVMRGSPSMPCEIAAAYGGIVAYQGGVDPAAPLRTLALEGILAPEIASRWTTAEENTLLYTGVSPIDVASDGTVELGRTLTMYRTNSAGADDTSYLDLQTVLTLSYLRYSLRNMVLSKYPRFKLADDGKNYVGQSIVTPSTLKAEIIALASTWNDNGLVEGLDAFKTGLIVQRNTSDTTRVDVLMTPDLINQFYICAVKIKYIL